MHSLLAIALVAGTWSYGAYTEAPAVRPKAAPPAPVVKSEPAAQRPGELTCKKHGCRGHDCKCAGFDCGGDKAKPCEFAAKVVAQAERTPTAEAEPLSNLVAAGITPVSRPRAATNCKMGCAGTRLCGKESCPDYCRTPCIAAAEVKPEFVPALPKPPVKWQCKDLNGKVWEHADKDFLEHWCQRRNAGIRAARKAATAPVVTYTAPAPTTSYYLPAPSFASGMPSFGSSGGGCAGGNCSGGFR